MMNFISCLSLFVAVRSICAIYSPIMDCDETFNYWEPLHYLTFGKGLQTWEYSPEFGLRTYLYLLLNGFPTWLYEMLTEKQEQDRVDLFYSLRAWFGLVCAFGEALFVHAIEKRYGSRTSSLTLVFLATNAGMFHSSTAFLPSTTCMYATLYAYWAWLMDRHGLALVIGSFAVLVCWPFCALMFVPLGLHALYCIGIAKVILVATASSVLFLGPSFWIDTELYGKPTLAIANLVLYNALGQGGDGQGANLYGTEPWHFYLQNLILNFNIVAVLGIMSPLLVLLLNGFRSKGEKKTISRTLTLTYLMGGFATMGLFTSMDHKEERFLSPMFPILCFGAALSIDLVYEAFDKLIGSRIKCLKYTMQLGVIMVVILSSAVSISRSAGLHFNFYGPNLVFDHFYHEVSQGSRGPSTICMAKEWYRFPSSYFLPEKSEILWLRSSFKGLLPQPFTPFPNGTKIVHKHFNDRNKEQVEAYAKNGIRSCDYAVDFDVGVDNGDIGEWAKHWERVYCVPFLDASKSPALIRSFYIPFGYSLKRNTYADYCLLKRKTES